MRKSVLQTFKEAGTRENKFLGLKKNKVMKKKKEKGENCWNIEKWKCPSEHIKGYFSEEHEPCLCNRWKAEDLTIAFLYHTGSSHTGKPISQSVYNSSINNFHLLYFSSLNVNILVHDLTWPLSILMESEKMMNTSKTQAHVQKVHQE